MADYGLAKFTTPTFDLGSFFGPGWDEDIEGIMQDPEAFLKKMREMQYPYSPTPQYQPYGEQYPIPQLPLYEGEGGFPGLQMPGYQPYPEYERFTTGTPQPGAYYNWDAYQGFGEEFPQYEAYTSPLMKQLSETISSRMRGEGVGTEAAEQAIWGRATERADVSARKAQQQMLEHFAGRGIPYSGPHLEQYGELGAEYQRQLGEVSREQAIQQSQQRQAAIESAMGRGQQFGQFGEAEAARAQAAREREFGFGLGEHRAEFESQTELEKERARETLASQRMSWQQQAQQSQLEQTAKQRGFEFEQGRMDQNAQIEYQAQVQAYQAMEQRAQSEYESLIRQGLTQAQAQQEAYRIAQEEYQREYESRLTEAERRGEYNRDWFQREQQRWLAEFAAEQQQQPQGRGLWDWISLLGSFF